MTNKRSEQVSIAANKLTFQRTCSTSRFESSQHGRVFSDTSPGSLEHKAATSRGSDLETQILSEGTPSTSTSYASEIFQGLVKSAADSAIGNRRFFSEHITMNMRSILVDWLIEVAEEYKLMPETLFLSVAYTDRCLVCMPIEKRELQLVGITCMFIAAKYEEIYAPEIGELCYITDNSYERNQIIRMEQDILKHLNFSLTIPTTNTFTSMFLMWSAAGKHCVNLASLLSELTLLNGAFLEFPSNVNASAVVFLANFYVQSETGVLYGILDSDIVLLAKCIGTLHDEFKNHSLSGLSSVREKYLDARYDHVSNTASRENPTDYFHLLTSKSHKRSPQLSLS